MVDRLRQRAGLPMPQVAIAPHQQPNALASALEKLQAAARQAPMPVSPTMAPLAQVNPLSAFRGGLASLFATHPPTEQRVARLRAIANSDGTHSG